MDLSSFASGNFLKPSEVVERMKRNANVATVISEGVVVKTQFKKPNGDVVEKVELDVKFDDGLEITATLNATSVGKISEAYGVESTKWINRKIRFETAKQMVNKEMKDVVYVFPVDAVASPVSAPVVGASALVKVKMVKEFPMPKIVANTNGVTYDVPAVGGVMELPAKDASFFFNHGYGVQMVDVVLPV